MTQLVPGRDTWLARADQASRVALSILIDTPLCQRYCNGSGSVRRKETAFQEGRQAKGGEAGP